MATAASLKVEKRPEVGKGHSRSLRREGRIPAIIYGNQLEPVSISLSIRELDTELRKEGFFNRLCDLEVGSEKN